MNAINKLIDDDDDDLVLRLKKISERIQEQVKLGKVSKLIEQLIQYLLVKIFKIIN